MFTVPPWLLGSCALEMGWDGCSRLAMLGVSVYSGMATRTARLKASRDSSDFVSLESVTLSMPMLIQPRSNLFCLFILHPYVRHPADVLANGVNCRLQRFHVCLTLLLCISLDLYHFLAEISNCHC